jgi:hypothetical protein
MRGTRRKQGETSGTRKREVKARKSKWKQGESRGEQFEQCKRNKGKRLETMAN